MMNEEHISRLREIKQMVEDETITPCLIEYKTISALEAAIWLLEADQNGRLKIMPVKQYQTVYYILDHTVYIGWYLAQAAEHTHLILQDKIEMGVCWVTDGFWFLTREAAEAAPAATTAQRKIGG